MKRISDLTDSLNGYLNWNKARAKYFLGMLLGLFAVKTVNLKERALAIESKASADSTSKSN